MPARAFDPAAARDVLDRPGLSALSGARRETVAALAGCSPFLRRVILMHSDFCLDVATQGPEAQWRDLMGALPAPREDRVAFMRQLRRQRARAALCVAYADVGGLWDLHRITSALSDFADACLEATVAHLVAAGIDRGWLDPACAPLSGGYFLLALGKLGGRELNYSSDIDLIALYDPMRACILGDKEPREQFIRLTRDLVRILEERTADGYVFRVDLRLRPDPGSTGIAMSVDTAEAYYQSTALNWERAAMIKARAVAGDREAADAYLARLSPFVWRRSVDFGLLDDIHAIKNQVHRHHNQRDVRVEGYNVKLGPGGIREVEFFSQINQLLAGGRDRRLRSARTLDALDALVASGRVAADVRDDLAAAYSFLRMVEHRLQMIEDEQTQIIPEDPERLRRLANFCGFNQVDSFRTTLLSHLLRVQKRYDALLPEEGGQDDRQLAGQIALIFEDPQRASAIIEGWQRGRYRAVRTHRARQALGRILPRLIDRLEAAASPDRALVRLDHFLEKLPAGAQLFALFHARPQLMALMVRIMGSAPALADHLARHAGLFDMVLDPGFFDPLADAQGLERELRALMEEARNYEEALDLVRRWLNDKRFQLGVHVLEFLAEPEEAREAYTRLADVSLTVLADRVAAHYAERFGRIEGAALAGVALGRQGGREMTAGSDLDLVLVYVTDDPGADPSQLVSDGPHGVAAPRYFSGLAQALITAVTALTREGRLYEVDTRLRPSGMQGPVAVHLGTFAHYYDETAWTWEHLALVRARAVLGPPAARAALEASIDAILERPIAAERMLADIARMRAQLAQGFPAPSPWSLKHHPGGLMDQEFLAQSLVLAHTARFGRPRPTRTADSLQHAAQLGLIGQEAAGRLIAANRLHLSLYNLLRLCIGEESEAAGFSPDLRSMLARAAGVEGFDAAEARLKAAQEDVKQIYAQIMAPPAAPASNPQP